MNAMSTEKRKYELKRAGAGSRTTRRRIAAATSELHAEVGPARTTVAEIARRAGVQRLTVYNNFPDEYALFARVPAALPDENPPPDPSPPSHSKTRGDRSKPFSASSTPGTGGPSACRRTSGATASCSGTRRAHGRDGRRQDGRARGRPPERARRRQRRARAARPFSPSRSTSGPGGGLRSRGSTMRPPLLMAETVLQQEHRSLPESSVPRRRPARPR